MLYFPQTLALAEYYNKAKLPIKSAILVLHPNYIDIVKIVSKMQEDMRKEEIVYLIPQGQPHTAGILIGKEIIICIDSRAPDQYFPLFNNSKVFKGKCAYAIVEANIGKARRAIQSDNQSCASLQLCIAKTLLKENPAGQRLAEELLRNAAKMLESQRALCVNLPTEVFKYVQSNKLVDYFIATNAINSNFFKKGISVDLLEYRRKYNDLEGRNNKLQLKEKEFCKLASYNLKNQMCNLENLDLKLSYLNKEGTNFSSLQRKRFSSISYTIFPEYKRCL